MMNYWHRWEIHNNEVISHDTDWIEEEVEEDRYNFKNFIGNAAWSVVIDAENLLVVQMKESGTWLIYKKKEN